MASFKYKAKSKKNKIVEGVLSAASEKEAAASLKAQNLSVLFIEKVGVKKKKRALFEKGITLLDKANLCRYLGTMISAGLSLGESVEAITEETTEPRMKEILGDVVISLQKGQPLSAAFSKHSDVFDDVFLTLIEAGEKSGTLDKSFKYLGKQLYSDYELTQKVKSTLAYPIVIILATAGLGAALLVFVLPRIAPVLLRLHNDFPLPAYTLLILKTGVLISENLLILGLVSLFIPVGLVLGFRTAKGKQLFSEGLARLPFFGQLILKLSLARFSRTLSTLLKSGIPIVESLRVASNALTLARFKVIEKTFVEKVSQGVNLSQILKEGNLFPSIMVRMVATGEKTGEIDKLLLELAKFYEGEVSNDLKTLTSVIEPVLMLVIGIGVGAMVIMVISPIYSFVGSLSQSLTSH